MIRWRGKGRDWELGMLVAVDAEGGGELLLFRGIVVILPFNFETTLLEWQHQASES